MQLRLDGGKAPKGRMTATTCSQCGRLMAEIGRMLKCVACGHVDIRKSSLLVFMDDFKNYKCPECNGSGRAHVNGKLKARGNKI
jgi:predicted RNA-binding Zn-ribbon protein involved in translation (DUF1610 family)